MTPQTITITTARGETFTMNFDGPVFVEVKDDKPQSTDQFAIGDTVEWTDKRLGKKSGVVTDIIGHALKIGEHVTIWDHDARKATPSTAPKFKVGDVVWWCDCDGNKFYGKVTNSDEYGTAYQCLGGGRDGLFSAMPTNRLHHDYRTVAGGGWRKCEVGKVYKARNGHQLKFTGKWHDENGLKITFIPPWRDKSDPQYKNSHDWDLVEELP